jgi:hypothetical protein
MKKRIFTAILVLVMALTVAFTACDIKEPENTSLPAYTTLPTTTTEPVTEIATGDETTDVGESESDTNTDITTENDTTISIVTNNSNTTILVETDAPSTEATNPPTPTEQNLSCSALASNIASKTNMFEEVLEEGNVGRAVSLFGISEGSYSDISYYTASAGVAEEILIVKATDESQISSIVSGMENRKNTQIDDYSDYVPKEVPKLNNATIYTDGLYVVYCVSNDYETASNLIRSMF